MPAIRVTSNWSDFIHTEDNPWVFPEEVEQESESVIFSLRCPACGEGLDSLRLLINTTGWEECIVNEQGDITETIESQVEYGDVDCYSCPECNYEELSLTPFEEEAEEYNNKLLKEAEKPKDMLFRRSKKGGKLC